MTNKHIINTCEFFNECKSACGGTLEDTKLCSCYELYKQLKRKEQTLIEIKEMCSEIDCESLMENSWCGNTDFKMGCCEKFFKRQILQVIRESEIKHDL